LQALVRELDAAGHDLKALWEQSSLQSLVRAVGTLDETRARAALIRAVVDLKPQLDPNWRQWVMRP